MLLRRRTLPPIVPLLHSHRRYSTSYKGRITRATSSGRELSVEVSLPSNLIHDYGRNHTLPRRDLICQITSLINSRSHYDDIFLTLSDRLKSLTPPLTTTEASEILKSLSTSPSLCFSFFQFLSSPSLPSFRHDCFTYNRILSILAKSSAVVERESVDKMVKEMEREGVKGNVSTVNILIYMLGGQGVEWCLELGRKWELRLSGYTHKCVLQAYLRSHDVEKAWEVFKEMRRKGFVLDVFVYNMLLDALAKADMVERAYKVFAYMKSKHCHPDTYTYTILIRMAGRMEKVDDVVMFFNDMMAKGCEMNRISYNTMIQALAKNKMVGKTLAVFSKMIENECRPNEFTYTFVLEVLASEDQLHRVNEVVEISKKFLNKRIYSFMVKTLTKLGHSREAHDIFCKMWNLDDDRADRDAYISMLESLCSAGKITEAMDLLYKIKEKGLTAESIMYNIVLSTLCKLKEMNHTDTLYKHMKQVGCSPDIFTYNMLISSYGRTGQVEKALRLFEEMENTDCKPDVITYNSLINCLGKNGNLDEAHMLFKEMQEKGLSADVFTYSTLIECFGRHKCVEMACRLFDEMLADGCTPNIVTYNILLDCLEKCGKTDEAFKMYTKLKQQGLTPDAITYTVLERLQSGISSAPKLRKRFRVAGWVVSPLS